MLTFSWTGKKKKKLEIDGPTKIDSIEHFPHEPSVSRSTTTSDGSINISHHVTFQSSLSAVFKDAELSGRLMLKGFRLTDIPAELFDNSELLDVVLLDLSDNDLSHLSDHFGLFDSLMSLTARSNRFRDFPTCITYLERLTYLDLSFNRLALFPDSLFDLPLGTLKLAGNRLTGLPESMRHLSPTLVHLDLSRNELEQIPLHLRHLKHLRVLKLSHNRIEDYPAELCSLNLRTLDLNNNQLSYLPRELARCRSIDKLTLARNPLRFPPMSVIEKGIMHVFKWLEINPAQPTRKVSEKETRKPVAEEIEKSVKLIKTNNNNTVNGFTTIHKEVAERRLPVARSQIPQTPSPTESLNSPNANTIQSTTKSSETEKTPDGPNSKSTNTHSVDEQNNNKAIVGQKKPISKVAPMMKTNARAVSSTGTGLPQKPGMIRRTVPTTAKSTVANNTVRKEIPKPAVSKTNLARPKTVVRTEVKKSDELRATKPLTVSNSITNKAAPSKMNEIESAKKILREKLGSRGDLAFSNQLSDGVDLCKFVNKLNPQAVHIATNEDMPALTTRSRVNAERFVQYCKKHGVPETALCSTTDILGKKNVQKVAKTILCLAKQSSPKPIQC